MTPCQTESPRSKGFAALSHRTRLLSNRLLLVLAGLPLLAGSAQAAGGTVRAWGYGLAGQTTVPAGLGNVVAVAGGGQHSLALKLDGTVTAWGWHVFGETNVPAGLTNVVAIAANYGYSLALKSNGTVVGWGSKLSTVPADLTNVVAISAGNDHQLALRQNGTVVSWGNAYAPPPGLTNVIGIAAGFGHSVALRADGQPVAWGDNASGKTDVPPSLTNVVALAAGDHHTLALRANGTVVAWGRNTDGQTNVPTGLSAVVAIAAGGSHSLALKADGSVVAWGRNDFGQTDVPVPLTGVVGISGGGYHSLALVGDGSPVITGQPMSQTVVINSNAAFRVVATGNQPLLYQWSRDGVILTGATTSTLPRNNVQWADRGTYRVVVSNAFGTVTSSPAVLTVVSPPWITAQPRDTTVLLGENASFSVTANGPTPLSYQWMFEGADIADATTTRLTLSQVVLSQAGGYSVRVANPHGAITSAVATLTVRVQPPIITSPLTASGTQGSPFTYTIVAQHGETYGAVGLPPGLTFTPLTGVISGTPLEAGTFYPIISAANTSGQVSETLVLTIGSGIPVITSARTVAGTEGTAIVPYRIRATQSPTSFGAMNLPTGFAVDTNTGFITGTPVVAGTFTATILASNVWGVGSAPLQFNITNALVTGIQLGDVTYNYHSPYLLEFGFTLRDEAGNAIVTQPSLLSAICMENTHPGTTEVVWPTDEPNLPTATELITNLISETGVFISRGSSSTSGGKVTKTYLVLDYTESIADPMLNGDANGDGISDAVDSMVAGAQYFVSQQPFGAQIGVYEFHREDQDPNEVMGLTVDKEILNDAIAGIYTNYVNWFYAGSRCWDAVNAAIQALGDANPDEQHFVIFLSDGLDSSSTATVQQVINNARAGKVKVYCIAYGNNPDVATLGQITSRTGGRLFTAENLDDLFDQFAQIAKEIPAQYVLRWASLRRDTNEIAPFFLLSYQGHTATPAPWNWVTNHEVFEVYTTNQDINIDTNSEPPVTNITETIETNQFTRITLTWENDDLGAYFVSNCVGTVTEGVLRLVLDEEVQPSGITLRASYIPRFIRQLRLHYRANWPCTPILNATNVGEMLYGWTLTSTNAPDGSTWLLLSKPNPQSTVGSLPFPGFGPLLTFRFHDVLPKPKDAFALIEVDNSIYTNIPAGGQTFVFEAGNTAGFVTNHPALPFGTPVPWLLAHGFTNNFAAAETSDVDGDGVPTWREYRANTDPRDPASRFAVLEMSNDVYGRYQITFSTALNRQYRVESSADLMTWETMWDNIAGTGGPIKVTDPRSPVLAPQMHYRVLVW